MNRFNYIFKTLSDKLEIERVLEETSQQFGELKTDYERFKFALTILENTELLPNLKYTCNKDRSKSVEFRNEGNRLFLEKKDLNALKFYTASVANAPIDSEELSLAFANRSAVSLSLKNYEDCITDIERALSGKYPEHLKYKLHERNAKCYTYLGKGKSAAGCYNNALNLIYQSKLGEDKMNKFVQTVQEELKNLMVDVNDDCDSRYCNQSILDNKILKLSYPPNTEIVAACEAITINFNKEMGRHIVATRTINPGDVLVVEQPYASILLPTSYNYYCFKCLKRCHTLIPCDNCTKALFCGVECREECYKTSHWIECKVLPHLIDLGCGKLELLAVRTLLVASKCDKLRSLKKCISELDEQCCKELSDERLRGFNGAGQYRSDEYMAAHHLATNTNLRTNADVFRRSCFASCIIHCLDKMSNYFIINTVNNLVSGDRSAITSENYGDYFHNKCFAGGLLLRYLQIMPCNAHEVSEMCITKYLADKDEDVSINKNVDVCKIGDNSFVYDSREIGGALYPVLSLINHSCDPNVVRHSHKGDTVVLTAIQRIQEGDQIYDNYGYHHAVHDLPMRRRNLLSQYHFICSCIACKENWPPYHLLPEEIIYKEPKLGLYQYNFLISSLFIYIRSKVF